MKRASALSFLQALFQVIGILLFLLGFSLKDIIYMDLGILFFWFGNMFYGIKNISERVFFVAFQATFFTFLLGRTVSNIISNTEDIHIFSSEILIHTKLCIFIAAVSLFVTYWLAENIRFSIRTKTQKERQFQSNSKLNQAGTFNDDRYLSIRTVSKWLFFATYIFSILVTIEKAAFVQASGYAEYYISYQSSFPYFFVKLGDACQVCFFIFLATMPSKKQVQIPFILYFIESTVSLFGGKRSEFVVPLLLIILYCCVRNSIQESEEKWLTKGQVTLIAVMTPFLLAGLFFLNGYRFGRTTNDISLIKMIAGFFDNLGFSVNVISYEKFFEAQIPNKLYSIGDTIDYLRENVITQMFFDFPVYKSQTVEKALYGNNFTQTITYLYSPKFYLAGRGLGSSYIAEAYHDFGYLGIIVWSGIYSYVLKHLYSFRNTGIVHTTMAFCALKYILLAPRTMASAFFSEMINLNTWLVIIMVLVISKILRGGNRGVER